MYVQYGMYYMRQCEQTGGQESVFEDPIHQTAHTIPYCIYSCLHEDEPNRFITSKIQQKLKIKY